MSATAQAFARARLAPEEGAALRSHIAAAAEGAGLLRPAPRYALARFVFLASCFAACLALAWHASQVAVVAAAYAGLAYFVSQLAFVAHATLHGASGTHRPLNLALGQLSMTLAAGLGYDEWKKRHRDHHRFCQIEERDPDMAVDLVVSLTQRSARSKPEGARALGRYQGVYIWPLAFLFGHSQRFLSQAGVLRAPRRHATDLAFLALHYALWIALPLFVLQVSPERVLAAYLIPATLLGAHLAAVFWVNHVGMPLINDPAAFSFVERQVVTTRNIVVPGALDKAFGGLNFQIEHHLLPACPPHRLRALRELLKPILVEAGLPYREMGWREALGEVRGHLSDVARTMNVRKESP